MTGNAINQLIPAITKFTGNTSNKHGILHKMT